MTIIINFGTIKNTKTKRWYASFQRDCGNFCSISAYKQYYLFRDILFCNAATNWKIVSRGVRLDLFLQVALFKTTQDIKFLHLTSVLIKG